MKNKKHDRGFTIIETMIYIGIFALVMTGALVSVYAILGSQARNQAKAMVAEEGAFLLGKIDWTLTGVKAIDEPNDNVSTTIDYGNDLEVTKFSDSIVKLKLEGTDLKVDGSTLNNSNIKVECPFFSNNCFEHKSPSGDGIIPESIEAKFRVTSKTSEGLSFYQDFSTIKYLRK